MAISNTSPKRITFSGTMNAIDFEVMYNVKLKRICKGYSQEETAFLLGREKNYISNKERLETRKGYTVEEIDRLSLILDYDNPSFFSRNPCKGGYSMYAGQEIRENGKIYHEVRMKGKNGKSSNLLFRIEEDDPEVIAFPETEKNQLEKLKTFITALCEIGYFIGAKAPWQIFMLCSRPLNYYVTPRLVEQALNHFIQQKKITKRLKDGQAIYRSTEAAYLLDAKNETQKTKRRKKKVTNSKKK